MADAPKLEQFNNNLVVTKGNVEEVRDGVKSAISKAKVVEQALKTFGRIESAADSVGDAISGLKNGVRLLEKVGPLKVVGQALRKALDKMEDTVKKIEKKAGEIDERLDPAKAKVKEALVDLLTPMVKNKA